MTSDRTKAARDLLAFYREAGVDALLGEEPVNRLAGEAQPIALAPHPDSAGPEPDGASGGSKFESYTLQPAAPSVSRMAPANAPPPPDIAAGAAREAAAGAQTLDDLRAILERFDGCALKATASRLVFADGNPQARLMFVGEAPGAEEDREGLPFVGRSGKLLDRMIAAIGLDRSSVYIANIIPWRPPGNRTPTPQEAAICLPFMRRQIELADPDILVCLGGPSAQALLGAKEGILRTRGRWFNFNAGGRDIRAMATLHPAYLLRQPLQKRLAWRDFLAIKKALEAAGTSSP